MHPAFLLAACAGGAYWLHRRARPGDWRDLAHRLGLAFRDLGAAGIELELTGMPRPIRVERHRGSTRLWTTYPIAAGPRFAAVPKDRRELADRQLLSRRFGPATLLSVSPRFEASYWTFTRERERTSMVLQGGALAVTDTLLDEVPGVTLVSHRRILELAIRDPQPAHHGARAVLTAICDMANRDLFGLGALRSLPGSRQACEPHSLDLDGAPVISIVTPDGRPVHFRPVASAEDGATLAATEVYAEVGAGPAFEATIAADGSLAGQVPRGSVPVEAAVELPRLGGGTLTVGDGTASFRWPGITTDPAVLHAGARFVAAFKARATRAE